MTYNVVLDTLPTADVDVSVTPQDGTLAAAPGSLTFTTGNWNMPQTVTVTITDDGVDNGVEGVFSRTLTHAVTSADGGYNGVPARPSNIITVQIFDNDATAACSSTVTCAAGTYAGNAADGTSGGVCIPCPEGHYCLGGDCTVLPTPCSTGTANPSTGGDAPGDCAACASGRYSDSTGAAACTECPAGMDCSTASATPTLCAAGTASGAGVADCTDCVAGEYGPYTGMAACIECPEGFLCPGTANTAPTRCPAGRYTEGDTGRTSCTACPSGEACPAPFAVDEDCPAGRYQQGNAGFCVPCPAGHSCASSTAAPTPCTAGTYSPTGQASCIACAEGTYTDKAGSEVCEPCPAGYDCSDQAVTPMACAAGTFSVDGEEGCTACAAGTYADTAGSASCTLCPAGHACASVSAAPTPCPAGQTSVGGEAACAACDAGTWAAAGGDLCVECPPGFDCTDPAVEPVACPAGTTSQTGRDGQGCDDCGAGFFCPSPAELPQPCPVGTYQDAAQATSCTECPAGSACTDPAVAPVACAAGRYSPAGYTVCLVCPNGYACPSAAELPTECPPGRYNSPSIATASRTACAVCPTDNACQDPSTEPVPCPTGYFVSASGGECVACPVGFECGSTSGPVQATACTAGRYAAVQAATTCTDCPAGSACPSTSAPPERCTAGSYSAATATTCTECPAGSSCADPAVAPVACGTGEYSRPGMTSCIVCPAGHICPYPALDAPIPCPLGTTVNAGLDACVDCPAGSYCPDPRGSPVACPGGTYALGRATVCQQCPAGYTCPSQSSISGNVKCPAGSYSPAGSALCSQCPSGQFCPDEGAARPAGYCLPSNNQYSFRGDAACRTCPFGSSCAVNGAGTGVTTTACTAGTFRTDWLVELVASADPNQHHAVCVPCPAGYACPNVGRDPEVCPPGRYSPASQTTCTDCGAGFYCPDEGTLAPIQCPIGTFASSATAVQCQYCDPGVLCDAGATTADNDAGACNVPEGFWFNPYEDALPPTLGQLLTPCPAGYHASGATCTSSFQAACTICPAGEYCEQYASSAATDEYRDTCPAGHICPTGTAFRTEYPCPVGRYNGATGQSLLTACIECPAGSYCMEGAVAPVPCEEGFFCEAGTGIDTQYPCAAGTYSNNTGLTAPGDCVTCPLGHYCPDASNSPIPCRSGTYNPTVNVGFADGCLPCEAGRVCDGSGLSASNRDCCKGFYCPSGTAICTEYQCPAGTYMPYVNATSEDDCLQCPAGFACPRRTGVASEQPIPCAKGHYCPAGTQRQREFACPKGRYTPTTSAESALQCTECDAGFYCEGGEDTVTDDCPAGHYCPAGTTASTEFPCPAGRYRIALNAQASTDCDLCPVGHYCLEGTVYPVPCEGGSYSSAVGAQAPQRTGGIHPAECPVCPGGFECPPGTSDPVPCGLGRYSDDGEATCSPCLFGHHCDAVSVSWTDMRTNRRCAAGAFCPTGMDHVPVSPADDCPVGFQCPEGGGEDGVGSREPYPVPCPPGTFADTPGHGTCDPCPAGSYCLEGSINPSGPCGWGYYCPIGSTSPTQVHCAGGSYRDTTGAASQGDCLACPEGGFCVEGAASPELCPPGSYCPASTEYPVPCPKGRFGNGTGLSSEGHCRLCLPGYYCDEVGMSAPRGLCDPGFFCVQGSATAQPELSEPVDWDKGGLTAGVGEGSYGGICPAGSYCPAGSWDPQPCPKGTYLQSQGQASSDDCQQCDAGTYCSGSTLPAPTGNCSAGYFCTGGAENPFQFEAPAGTYAPEGSSAPLQCLPGTYNPLRKQAVCQPCPAGFFCPVLGMTEPTVCPAGSFCPPGNETDTLCPLGRYSAEQGVRSEEECLLCRAGSYCGTNGLTAPSGLCDAGYYCPPGQEVRNPAGLECPPGQYCEAGSVVGDPCPAGRYQPGTLAGSPTACTACPPGFACPTGSILPQECREGFFCAGSTESSTPSGAVPALGGVCPAGSSCPTNSSSPTACPAGRYANTTGRVQCDPCPIGTICSGTGTEIPTPCPAGGYCNVTGMTGAVSCPAGTYQPLTGTVDETDCLSCDAGKYCASSDLQMPSGDCDAGYYCLGGAISSRGGDGASNATNLPCPEGSFCPLGSAFPTLCPPGTYLNGTAAQSEADCQLCDAGQFCSVAGLPLPEGPCDAGFYCVQGVQSSRPSTGVEDVPPHGDVGGDICPPGTWCPAGSISPTGCAAGRYSAQPGTTTPCTVCPEGFFCTGNSTAFTGTAESGVCPAGHFCPAGSTSGTGSPCPAGTYRNATGGIALDDCSPCPAGSFCAGIGNVVPTGACSAGFYCNGSSTVADASDGTGGPCVPGEYCPEGSVSPVPCTAGAFCPGAQRTSSSPDGPCAGGYYCQSGSWTATPAGEEQRFGVGVIGDVCPAGHFCPSGSTRPQVCPNGTYNNATAQDSVDDCEACPAGMYCPRTGTVLATLSCPEGFYCPLGTTSPLLLCWSGHFCPEGASTPTACSPGLFQNETGQATCKQCPPGFACGSGTVDPVQCSAGYWCPAGSTSAIANPCPAGTFSDIAGAWQAAQCEACPPGKYCSAAAMTAPGPACDGGHFCIGAASQSNPTDSDCPPGYTCASSQPGQSQNGTHTGSICPRGYYCPSGISSPVACPPGTHRNDTGMDSVDDCTPCPAGVYCPNAAATDPALLPCLAGFFCPQGTIYPNETCPAGHFCGAGVPSPSPCAAGTYGPVKGAASCVGCPDRHYCPFSASGLEEPVQCPAGYFCGPGQSSGTLQPCPAGTIGNSTGLATADECTDCPAGSFCASTGATAPDGTCAAGFYCNASAVSAMPTDGVTGNVCPAGAYCPAGTPAPQLCPPGRYTAPTTTGLQASTDCLLCPAGAFCPLAGMTNVTAEFACPAGFYCEPGTITPSLNCTAGSYCPEGSSAPTPCPVGSFEKSHNQSEPTCTPCLEGNFCPSTGLTEPQDCPAGRVCGPAQSSGADLSCPLGTFSSRVGLTNTSQCEQCGQGQYCDTTGRTTPAGPCAAGHFCLRNATTATPVDGTSGGQCLPGFQCGAGSGTPQPSLTYSAGNPCGPGTVCAAGATSPAPCAAGRYGRGYNATACDACPFGFECSVGTVDPAVCDAGGYCAGASADEVTCPDGTYSNNTGLATAGQCTACPPGLACVGGALLPCAAGYFCTSGAASVTGELCPGGFYCPAGSAIPTICANDTVSVAGSDEPSDCTDCPAGFRCERNVATLCEPGFYCALGADMTACPAGTYNPDAGSDALSDCRPCPDGYICNVPALSILDPHACPAGSYCENSCSGPGCAVPAQCPAGTYRGEEAGASVADCHTCPAGHVCADTGMLAPVICPAGFTCGAGTVEPVACPAGTFCGSGAVAPQVCPAGHYCPTNSTITPVVCPKSLYCPAGSISPSQCNVGFYGLPDVSRDVRQRGDVACQLCPAGSYSDRPGQASCSPCSPGFVCLGGTPTATPTDPDLHNGYICREGRYCPEGSAEEVPCPPGSVNPDQGAANATACQPCPAGQYQPEAAATACRPCGFTSDSNRGATNCQCAGRNRRYLAATATCVCDTFHAFTDADGKDISTQDGSAACEPIIYEICDSSQTRDAATGKCKPLGDNSLCASGRCPSGSGTYDASTGICECDELPDILEVCGPVCQSQVPRVSIDAATGLLRIDTLDTDTTSASFGSFNTTLLPLDAVPGLLAGDVACLPGLQDGQSGEGAVGDSVAITADTLATARSNGATATVCSVRSVVSGSDGFFGQYGVPAPVRSTVQSGVTIPLTFNNSTASGSRLLTPLFGVSAAESGALASLGIRRGAEVNEQARAMLGRHVHVSHDMLHAHILVADHQTGAARRLQASSGPSRADIEAEAPSIQQPMVCLSLGDTLMWDLREGGGFPVYVRDSLLNSNPDFDYGQFEQLAATQRAYGNVTLFAFTFRDAGVYAFTMSNNPDASMLVTVASAGSSCPTDGPIVPMNLATLIEVGARRNDELVLDVDWVFVAWTVVLFVLSVSLVVLGFCYCHYSPWAKGRVSRRVAYRRKGTRANLLLMHQKGQNTEIVQVADSGAKPAEAKEDVASTALASFARGSSMVKPLGPGALETVFEADSEEEAEDEELRDAIADIVEGRAGGQVDDAVVAALMSGGSSAGGWDVDDLELSEVLERVKEHASSTTATFGNRLESMGALVSTLRDEAESIKRILRRAAYEQRVLKMGGAGAAHEEDAAKVAAGEEVLTELTKRAATDKSLAEVEADLISKLFALTDALRGGEAQVADRATQELRAGTAQVLAEVSPDDEESIVFRIEGPHGPEGPPLVPVVDVVPESTLGDIGERVVALQGAMDKAASLMAEEQARRGSSVPVWKAAGDLGIVDEDAAADARHEGGVAGLLTDAKTEEDAVTSAVNRLLEALEPFAAVAPGVHAELGATVVETGSVLAYSTRVPSLEALQDMQGGKSGKRRALRRSSSSEYSADSEEPLLGEYSDEEGSVGGVAAGRLPLLDDVESGPMVGSAVGPEEWLSKSAYVEAVNTASSDARRRVEVAVGDLVKVLSIIQSQVPNLKASAEEHRVGLSAARDAVYNEVAQYLDTVKDRVDDERDNKASGASINASEVSALMSRLGALVKEKGGVPVDPLTASIAVRGTLEAEEEAAHEEEAGDEAGDSKPDARARSDSAGSAVSTHAAALQAVSAAVEAQMDADAEKQKAAVLEEVSKVESEQGATAEERKADISAQAAEDVERLSSALQLDDSTKAKLSAAAAADAEAMAAALEQEAEQAKADIELQLREERRRGAEQKVRAAEAGVVAEMEASVAAKAADIADSHDAERASEREAYAVQLAEVEEEAAALEAAEAAKFERQERELLEAIATAQAAAVAGEQESIEAAEAAAAKAAALQAAKEREEALKTAHAQVQSLQRDAEAQMDALREQHHAALEAMQAKHDKEREEELTGLRKRLEAEREAATSAMYAKHSKELESATTAAERESLLAGHAAEREAMEAELAEKEEEEQASLQARLEKAAETIGSEREALFAAHERDVQAVTERLAEARAQHSAGLRQRLAERKKRRAQALAEKHARERAEAEESARQAAADGDVARAEGILASSEAVHAAEAQGLQEEDARADEAAEAADEANAGVMRAVLNTESKIAAATAKAQGEIAAVRQAAAAAREAAEAAIEDKLREKTDRKTAMVTAKLQGEVEAAGGDPERLSAARAAAERELQAFAQQLEAERVHEQEILAAKLAASDREAAAKIKLLRASLDDDIEAIKLQSEADIAAAMAGVRTEAQEAAEAARARLRDKRIRQLRNITVQAEAQRQAIDKERSSQAGALEARLGAQAAEASTWTSDLLSKVQSASTSAGASARSEAEMARVKAEAAAEAERLAKEQAEEQARATAAEEERAQAARIEAARKSAEEMERLLADKRAAQQAALQAASGDQAAVARMKEEHAAELAEYSKTLEASKAAQQRKLEAKLEARRARKAKALARKQALERKDAEGAHARAAASAAAMAAQDAEKAALKKILEDGSIPPERKADAIEAVLGERHARETAELLAAQYAERQARRKAMLETLYEEKRGIIAEAVEEAREGGASDAEVDELIAGLQQEFEGRAAAEGAELGREMEAEHARQVIELRQRQLAEVSDAFSSLAPEDILRRHEMETAAAEAAELADFQAEMEREKERRLAELEARQAAAKAAWEQEQQAAMRALEEEQAKIAAEQEAEARRQRGIQEAKELAEEQARAAAAEASASGLSEEERARIMETYKQDASRRKAALASERERQDSQMRARLAKRRRKKQLALQRQMESDRAAFEESARQQRASVVSTVHGNMQRTMSALANRAARRSMASMARLTPRRPSEEASRVDRPPASGEAPHSDSAQESQAGSSLPAGLAAAAAAYNQKGADLASIGARIAAVEAAMQDLLQRSAAVQGTSASSGLASARSDVGDADAHGGMLAVAASALPSSLPSSRGAGSTSDVLVPLPEQGLTHRRRVRLRFARAIVMAVGMAPEHGALQGPRGGRVPTVKVEAAAAFPRKAPADHVFRGAIFIDPSAGTDPLTLYVKAELLDHTVQLYSILNYALAVLREGDASFADTTSPDVLAALNKHFMVCGQELYRSMAAVSAGSRDMKEALREPSARAAPSRGSSFQRVASMSQAAGRHTPRTGSARGSFTAGMGIPRSGSGLVRPGSLKRIGSQL